VAALLLFKVKEINSIAASSLSPIAFSTAFWQRVIVVTFFLGGCQKCEK
jgi:hypothetical protein